MWKRSRHSTIKSDWAAMVLAPDNSVLLAVKTGGRPRCLRFESSDQFLQARTKGHVSFRFCAVGIPRELCILKSLTLPASNLTEASRMLEFELPTLLPIPSDQLIYGCAPIQTRENQMDILVCLLKQEKLKNHLAPFHALKVDPLRCVPDPWSMLQFISSTVPDIQSQPVLVVRVEPNRCELLTCLAGRLVRTDEIALDPEPNLVRHIDRLSSSDQPAPLVLLAGPPDLTAQLQAHLTNAYSDRPAPRIQIVASPTVEPNSGEFQSLLISQQYATPAMVALGLLDLAEQTLLPSLNLVPPDVVNRFTRRLKRKNNLLTASLAVLLVLLLWLCLTAVNARLTQRAQRIEARIEPIKNIAGEVETKRRRIKALQNQLADRGVITRILHDLYRHTPNTIAISELRYKSLHASHTLQLKGQADILAAAFGYTEAMREAPLLKNIQLEDAQQVQKPGGSLVEFRARCLIKGQQP